MERLGVYRPESTVVESHFVAPLYRPRPVKTALHQAVLDGRIHQVRLLVLRHGIGVDTKDVFGRTPLMLACLLENSEQGLKMVRIFLKAGAYPNVRDNMNRTALSYACMRGRETIVGRLLQEDTIDYNTPDNDGNTPLCHATLSANPDVVRLLVEQLADYPTAIDHRNNMGYTPLLLACKHAHYASAHILLTAAKANPSIRDNQFFLDASSWMEQSRRVGIVSGGSGMRLRTGSNHAGAPQFSRENTMYATRTTKSCHHFTPVANSITQSIDSALRLPAVFSSVGTVDLQKEEVLAEDGSNARRAVIRLLDASQSKTRPLSRTMSTLLKRRILNAGTAKLRSLEPRRSNPLAIPDMRTIFRIYSDQYAANLRWTGPEREEVQLPLSELEQTEVHSTRTDAVDSVTHVPVPSCPS